MRALRTDAREGPCRTAAFLCGLEAVPVRRALPVRGAALAAAKRMRTDDAAVAAVVAGLPIARPGGELWDRAFEVAPARTPVRTLPSRTHTLHRPIPAALRAARRVAGIDPVVTTRETSIVTETWIVAWIAHIGTEGSGEGIAERP